MLSSSCVLFLAAGPAAMTMQSFALLSGCRPNLQGRAHLPGRRPHRHHARDHDILLMKHPLVGQDGVLI